MAAPRKMPELEELIEFAAQEALQQNPHLFNPPEPRADEEEAALRAEWEAYQQNIAPYVEEERAQGSSRPISEIICEDRGE